MNQLETAINILIDVNRSMSMNARYEDMQTVFARIEGCWDYETSYYDAKGIKPDDIQLMFWNGYFQCATTTALLYELFGGEVMQGEVDGRKHYWNRINGIDVDLTRRQFDSGTIITNIVAIAPSKLVTDEWMAERCNNLKRKYEEALKKEAIYK